MFFIQNDSFLHNSDGSINIPDFYEDVVQVSQSDRNELAKAPFNLNEYQQDLAVDEYMGNLDILQMKEHQLDHL